ncbi:MAG: Twin-arginine translocation protein TatA [uncultured Thermomicrobiales bacterium]|uniref:Sec-independent protein translocase protein TatA n=1 Tax=uncultured Thermomicrobiales bacterium TaxID=1645740 RepID=A0A6J4TMF4_9BACT|nr:MAG: Twin-arginine translocation protein TatA [uncultured Thermomicrobiales bacterium]
MAGLGWQELTIILVIVIIIFGAGKLPEIGGALGKGIKEFKTNSNDDDALPGGSTTTASTTTRRQEEPVARREIRADEI